MAAVPSTPVVALPDASLNHFIIDSPTHADTDSPHGPAEPESPSKAARSLRKSSARASLAARDSNEREGLLVDFGQDESSRSPPSSLHPRTPSAFARSLLDKSPSLLKAHLSTPLIPLGTPVTSRKARSTSPDKENATPSARRRAKHHSPDSPSPAAESPHLTSRADAPTSTRTVRFSPSPRRTRSSPRKVAASSSALAGTPSTVAFHQPTSSSTSSRPIHSLHHIGLATPIATSRTHLFASPFPAFSPSTPAIRSHTSYDTDELTDADADGSIWEDEPSLSYPAPAQADAQVDEVALAVGGLSLGESPAVDPAPMRDEQDGENEWEEGEVLGEDELTETETAMSKDDEEELAGSAEELAPASLAVCEAAAQPPTQLDEPALDAADHVELALDERVLEQHAPVLPVVEDDAVTAVEASAASAPSIYPDTFAPAFNGAELPRADQCPNAPVAFGPGPSSSSRPEPVQQGVELPSEPVSSDLDVAAPLEIEEHGLVDAVVAEALSDSAAEGPVVAGLVAPDAPSARRGLDKHSEGVAAAALPQADIGRRATPPPSPFLAASAASQPAPPLATPSFRLNTPSPTRISASAATPVPSATPSAPQPAQPSVSAAPTSRRQLTKLTSAATSRTALATATKSSLTTLVPGSAAASTRRLAAPSRLAVPTKRSTATSSIAEAPAVPAPSANASDAPRVGELKCPASALSASSASTASTGSSAPSSSLGRPRAAVRPGFRPTATTSAASGLARSTLASSGRSAAAALAHAPTARPTAATTSRLSRPLTVPRPAPGASAASSSRLARSETSATAASSRPLVASRAGPALGATSSAPSLGPSRAPTRALGASSTARAAPRAALAVRQAAAGVTAAAATQPTMTSPSKARAVRVFDGVVVASKAAPSSSSVLPPPRAASPPPLPRVELHARDDDRPTLAAPLLAQSVGPSTHSPFLGNPHSPPPSTAARAPASPLRSPRRVPVNSQGAGPAPSLRVAPSLSLAPTALVAPADKLAPTAAATLFEPAVRSTAPPVVRSAAPRAVRARRTRATEAELLAAAAPAVLAAPAAGPHAPGPVAATRTTRRAATTAVAPPKLAPAPVVPIVRSARRPARREPSAEEAVAAPAVPIEDDASSAPTSSSSEQDAAESVRPRPAPQFHPAPAVTQDELNRLTQRNTKRNEQHLNKLKLVTVYMDTDRPPSPTSKLRRSFGSEAPEVVRASTKAGREARAAKRRNALRASVDGTELAQLAADLLAEGEAAAGATEATAGEQEDERPRLHFRAAGDDEQYSTPTRAPPIKSKTGTKKRSSAAEDDGEADARRDHKAVRWDRALVYEGPKEGEGPVPDSSILKLADLDDWGNSTTATTNLGKAVPVTIHMRVFKDEQ
ncbi:hypothetical protein JCM3775_000865 [Rhodotorula graminis]